MPGPASGSRLLTVVAQALDADRRGVPEIALTIRRPGTALGLERVTRADGMTEDVSGTLALIEPADRPPTVGPFKLTASDPAALASVDELLHCTCSTSFV